MVNMMTWAYQGPEMLSFEPMVSPSVILSIFFHLLFCRGVRHIPLPLYPLYFLFFKEAGLRHSTGERPFIFGSITGPCLFHLNQFIDDYTSTDSYHYCNLSDSLAPQGHGISRTTQHNAT